MNLSGIQQEVGESPKKVCAVCQAPADKSCGACHQIDYCSADHQRSHWKVHKKDCLPIKIVSSPELGPHFVVTRDLPPGTLLLTELPVLVNPYKNIDDQSCISCRSFLPSKPWTCLKCSTPFFCNQSCSMNKIHSEAECSILSKCSAEQKEKICNTANMMVSYLRGIHLKNTDPLTWGKVLELPGAYQHKPGDLDDNDKWFIREILPFLGDMGVGYEADIAKLKGIDQQKGIGDQSEEGHGESDLIYLRASNFVQNCFPNCTPIIGKGPEFKLEIRSTVGLKKGQIPSIDYIRISNGVGASYRQHRQLDVKGALCICPRCTDPTGTDLGTMLSAVKCLEPNCEEGYLLPVNVEDMAENAPWRCNRADCKGKGSTWKAVDDMIQKLNNCMLLFISESRGIDMEQTVNILESFKKFLHPNHWLILGIKNLKIDKILPNMDEIENKKGKLSIPEIQLYISMIEDVLKMTEIIAPGLSIVRARLWNNLLTLLVPKFADIKCGQDSCDKEMEEGFKKRIIEAVGQLRLIAKFYPECFSTEYDEIMKAFLPELQL